MSGNEKFGGVFYTDGGDTAEKGKGKRPSYTLAANKKLPTRKELGAYITNEVNSVVAEYDGHNPDGERSTGDVYEVFKTRAYLIERLLLAIASQEQEKNTPDEDLLQKTVNGIQTMERLLEIIPGNSSENSDEHENNPGYTYIANDLTRELLNQLNGEFIDTYYPFLKNSHRTLRKTPKNENNVSDKRYLLEGIDLTQEDLDWYQIFQEKMNVLMGDNENKEKSDLTDFDCSLIQSLLEALLAKIHDDRIDTKDLLSYKTLINIQEKALTTQPDKKYNTEFIKLNYGIIKGAMSNILQIIKNEFVESNL